MPLTPEAIEKRLTDDAEKDRQERQERRREARERAAATEAREARWEALSAAERLRLGTIAHWRGVDPRDLMDTNTKENHDA